jgi:hypothetical protein
VQGRNTKVTRVLVPLLATSVALLLATFIASSLLGIFGSNSRTVRARDPLTVISPPVASVNEPAARLRDASNPERLDISMGMLCDYYEHMMEHAPPRQPGGSMQRRERRYVTPQDPFDTLRSSLASTDLNRSQWASQLDEVERSIITHGRIDAATSETLGAWVAHSPVRAMPLLEAGRAMDFLAGDAVAAMFYRAALCKARDEFHDARPGAPGSSELLIALDQTKALWTLSDWQALEQRFALAAQLYPPLSVEARRSAYLHAEAIFRQGRWEEAADLIVRVQQCHEQVGDLDVAERGDVDEMNWVLGAFLAKAGRYSHAVSHLEQCEKPGSVHEREAALSLAVAYAHCGRVSDAVQRLKSYANRYGTTVELVETAEALRKSLR